MADESPEVEPVDPYMLKPSTPAPRPPDLFPNPPADLPILRRKP